MERRLLVSIHDVSPRFEREVDRLIALIENRIGQANFAMLVVPDHWGQGAIAPGSGFADRLARWAAAGVEMFVHGWYHRDDARHPGSAARLKARLMTAGEGEFLGLGEAEAARRMAEGERLVRAATGVEPIGFIAPAWLYGEGARAALAGSRFRVAEDHMRVWSPVERGRQLARGPVLTWASRSAARTASSLAAAAAGRHLLRPLATVRVAVHPGDTSKPTIERSIDATLAALARSHAPARYAELLAR